MESRQCYVYGRLLYERDILSAQGNFDIIPQGMTYKWKVVLARSKKRVRKVLDKKKNVQKPYGRKK